MHRGDRGEPRLARGAADEPARQTVAAGAERGAGDDDVRRERAEVAGDRGQRLVRALVDEVVPADHGADDAAGLAEQRLERAPGADGALARGHALVGALLAPDAGEELIDVV